MGFEEEDSERRVAIIIMTAKEAGPADTLDDYFWRRPRP